MKKYMIALVAVFGIFSGAFAAPTAASAQTPYEILNLAADAEAAAKKAYDSAENIQAMENEAATNVFLKSLAPTETAVLRQRAMAAHKATLRKARAYELMAAKLRDHARTLR